MDRLQDASSLFTQIGYHPSHEIAVDLSPEKLPDNLAKMMYAFTDDQCPSDPNYMIFSGFFPVQ